MYVSYTGKSKSSSVGCPTNVILRNNIFKEGACRFGLVSAKCDDGGDPIALACGNTWEGAGTSISYPDPLGLGCFKNTDTYWTQDADVCP